MTFTAAMHKKSHTCILMCSTSEPFVFLVVSRHLRQVWSRPQRPKFFLILVVVVVLSDVVVFVYVVTLARRRSLAVQSQRRLHDVTIDHRVVGSQVPYETAQASQLVPDLPQQFGNGLPLTVVAFARVCLVVDGDRREERRIRRHWHDRRQQATDVEVYRLIILFKAVRHRSIVGRSFGIYSVIDTGIGASCDYR